MKRGEIPEPLPEEWLPPPATGGDPEEWERRVRAVVRAAEPTLAGYRAGSTATLGWWRALAEWWRPVGVGGLAVAAAAVVALLLVPAPEGVGGEANPALAAVVGEGEPAALWSAGGEEADPALAALVLEEGRR